MTELETIQGRTLLMIDDLKAICTSYGLGNSGNEYKIITETFLYKFLNDKFFYEIRKANPEYSQLDTAAMERRLSDLSDDELELLSLGLPAGVARLKPAQFISTLFNQKAKQDFHKMFDEALTAIADQNRDVFSVKAGGDSSVSLFETLSNYVVQTDKRDAFCAALVNKLANVNFDAIFGQKYDFFADIFEYLIKDYNKDFGKYAEYYTPHAIAQIIAKILVPRGDANARIYDKTIASLIQASGKDKSSKSLDIRGFEDFTLMDLVA